MTTNTKKTLSLTPHHGANGSAEWSMMTVNDSRFVIRENAYAKQATNDDKFVKLDLYA